MSVSGSAFTISYSFLAGTVTGPRLRNRRRRSGSEANFEIGRQQADFVSLRFHQHVGENRDRVLAFDDALEKLQFSQKVGLPDDKFHAVLTSESGFWGSRYPGLKGEIRRETKL